MKHDLDKLIDYLFKYAYKEEATGVEYQDTFADEGFRKAQYIVDDLLYRESHGRLKTSKAGYLCIGGADGSEVEKVLTETDISKAVMIEISEDAVNRATIRCDNLAEQGKVLVVIKGDATAELDSALRTLEAWLTTGEITTLICSAQGVLHELPRRSTGFDLPKFLGKLFRHPAWQVSNKFGS